jgi:hypothetical protein
MFFWNQKFQNNKKAIAIQAGGEVKKRFNAGWLN